MQCGFHCLKSLWRTSIQMKRTLSSFTLMVLTVILVIMVSKEEKKTAIRNTFYIILRSYTVDTHHKHSEHNSDLLHYYFL